IGVVDGDNDSAVRADDRLATDNPRVVCLGCSPGLPAIAGGAHLEEITCAVVVPFSVTVTVEWAAGRVVADNPVLVQIGASGGLERVPRGEAVGGAARHYAIPRHPPRLKESQ